MKDGIINHLNKLSRNYLRKITRDDLDFARKLRNVNRKYFFNNEHITVSQHREWFNELKYDMNYFFYIIWEKGKRVGTISIKVNTGEIGNMLIAEEYRGKGYCKKAIKDLLKLYPAKNVYVEVFPDDKITSIYKAIGFKEKKRTLWI